MIKIANAEKALETLISGGDEYHEIEFESSTQHPDGSVEINFSMQQAPRDLNDIICWEGSYDLQDVELADLSSEDASSSSFRSHTPALEKELLEKMGVDTDEPVFATLFGNTSAGQYCDDETDAYISGTLILGPQNAAATATSKSNKHMVDQINSCCTSLVRNASHNLTLLSKFDGKASKDMRDSIVSLNRIAVR